MSRFKIGQKVVCVKSHSEGLVIKRRVYCVESNVCPCKCNAIDVGVTSYNKHSHSLCSTCNHVYKASKEHYIGEWLFAPLKADMTSKELNLCIEEFELETIEYN